MGVVSAFWTGLRWSWELRSHQCTCWESAESTSSGTGLDHDCSHFLLDRHDGRRPISLSGTQIRQTTAATIPKSATVSGRCWGSPGLRAALLQSATPGTEPRHNPLFSATLILGSGYCLSHCTHCCLEHLGHGPAGSRPLRVEAAPWTNRLGPDPLDRVADPMRRGIDCFKLSEPMRASQEGIACSGRDSGHPGACCWLWNGCAAVPGFLAVASCVVVARAARSRALSVAWAGDERADHHAYGAGFFVVSGHPLRRRRRLSDGRSKRLLPLGSAAEQRTPPARPPGSTWAEQAWLLIGAYWIVLGTLCHSRAAA